MILVEYKSCNIPNAERIVLCRGSQCMAEFEEDLVGMCHRKVELDGLQSLSSYCTTLSIILKSLTMVLKSTEDILYLGIDLVNIHARVEDLKGGYQDLSDFDIGLLCFTGNQDTCKGDIQWRILFHRVLCKKVVKVELASCQCSQWTT